MTQKANRFKGKRVMKHSKEITKMDVDGTMGIHLEEETITEILSRLPVRSLFRFKCVLKSWMTLINEPYFVKKHLNHAKNNQNSQKICLLNNNLSFQYGLSLTLASLSPVQLVEDVQQVDWPCSGEVMSCKIYCCYDGLALIGVSEYNHLYNIKLWLWNPSTRESMVLPHIKFSERLDFTCALGYDSTSNDYKIFKIGRESSNEILALKSGSWRKIDKHPAGIYPLWWSTLDSPAFVHEAFHWLGSLNRSVVSFHILNEVYVELPMPDGWLVVSDINHLSYGISVLGGLLCVYSTHVHQWKYNFNLWVMKDYGVKESWNKLFNIQSTDLYPITPKYWFSDGEVLLHCKYLVRNRFVFKTSKESSGLWPQSDSEHFVNGFVYTESLFSPKLLA
ncbi:F-box/kelch-repeat protein At3g06240-like [Solanum dulcamara]|uniref:F-box/kelch-repeat protein At3g06240-like n=1 Tax=Solanum dulcamara TaxID=45834 RepID=UPI002484DA8B|nr:F-box/kelch-repeat protein At3g06240-like [Solanum dulcamara]